MSIFSKDDLDSDVNLFSESQRSEKNTEYLNIKVVIVGDHSVGKTTLLDSNDIGSFPVDYVRAIFDNYNMTITKKGVVCELAMWDTAGQEDYSRLRRLVYPETDIVIIAFDLTRRETFENVKKYWLPEIRECCGEDVKFLVAGCKSDLLEDEYGFQRNNFLSNKEILNLVKEIGAFTYIETSSKLFRNVRELFNVVCECSLISHFHPEKKTKKRGGMIKSIFAGKNVKVRDIVYENYRTKYNQEIKENERKTNEKEIASLKKIIFDDSKETEVLRKQLFIDRLPQDIVQFLLNRFVLIDLENDCYCLSPRFKNYREQLGLSSTLNEFKIKMVFGYFGGSRKNKKRRVFQVFFNFFVKRMGSLRSILPSRYQMIKIKSPPPVSYGPLSSRKKCTELRFINFYSDLDSQFQLHTVRNIIFPLEVDEMKKCFMKDTQKIESIFVTSLMNYIYKKNIPSAFSIQIRQLDKLRHLEISCFPRVNMNSRIEPLTSKSLKFLRLESSLTMIPDYISFSKKDFPSLETIELIFPKIDDGKKLSSDQADNIINHPRIRNLRLTKLNLKELAQRNLLLQIFGKESLEVLELSSCVFSFNDMLVDDWKDVLHEGMKVFRIIGFSGEYPHEFVEGLKEFEKRIGKGNFSFRLISKTQNI